MKKLILLGLITGLFSNIVIAQSTKDNKHHEIITEVFKVLSMKQNFDVYPDSIAFYPYLIKLKIEKNEHNKAIVKDIIASDSIIFKVFPNYLKFKEINFDKLLINTDKVEYRIPILFSGMMPSPSQRHLINHGLSIPNIRMLAGTNAILDVMDLYNNQPSEDGVMVYQYGSFSAKLLTIK